MDMYAMNGDPAMAAFRRAGQQRRFLMVTGTGVMVSVALIAWVVAHL